MNWKNSSLASMANTLYKSIRFHDFFKSHFKFAMQCSIKKARKKQKRRIELISQKKKIKVAFMFQTPAVWKYDRLYRLMENSDVFDPIVVLTPYNVNLFYDRAETMRVMEQSALYVEKNHYRFISAYDAEAKRWVDVKKLIDPDVVFFSKPYKDTLYQYHIYNFTDRLTCYAPYGFFISNHYRENSNFPFHNLLWQFFAETEYLKEVSEEHAVVKGENISITGCLPMENLMRKDYTPKDVWKPQQKPKKRVIWAPHHSIKPTEMFKVSSFLEIADLMVRLRNEYKDRVIFAFKPHPVLKTKLYQIWGVEKTDSYYDGWANAENSFDARGDYHSLFAGSDAMIHCSGSFIVEYLYTGKPVAYVYSKTRNPPDIGPIGDAALGAHYPMHCEADIRRFIEEVVLGENDKMRNIRRETVAKYLKSPNGKRFSENVYNSIVSGLGL